MVIMHNTGMRPARGGVQNAPALGGGSGACRAASQPGGTIIHTEAL